MCIPSWVVSIHVASEELFDLVAGKVIFEESQ